MSKSVIERTAFLVFAVAVACDADTLQFRDGSSVTGTWLGGTAHEIRFLVNNQAQSFPKSDIVEVTFGAISAPKPITAPKIVLQPDRTGVVYFEDPTERLIQLEWVISRKIPSSSLPGPTLWIWRVPGAHSPVRVTAGATMNFLVRLRNGEDPYKYELYPISSKGDYRQTISVRSGARPPALQMTVNVIGDGTYAISPVHFLGRGEYALSPRDSNESFCFGID